jgi:CBS domain-containing protein
MPDEIIDDELQEMYEEADKATKQLDANTLRASIRTLELGRPIAVEVGTSVQKAVHLMQQHRIGCVVVTRGGLLAGIFTERDVLMKIVESRNDLSEVKIDDVMTSNPEVLLEDDMIAFALNLMHVGGYRHVPVVDEQGKPVGVLSIKDIVEYLTAYFPQEVLNLPPKPIRTTQEREGA